VRNVSGGGAELAKLLGELGMIALEHVAHEMPRLGTRDDLEHLAVVLGGRGGARSVGDRELIELALDIGWNGDRARGEVVPCAGLDIEGVGRGSDLIALRGR
jgi:hypothetical protein